MTNGTPKAGEKGSGLAVVRRRGGSVEIREKGSGRLVSEKDPEGRSVARILVERSESGGVKRSKRAETTRETAVSRLVEQALEDFSMEQRRDRKPDVPVGPRRDLLPKQDESITTIEEFNRGLTVRKADDRNLLNRTFDELTSGVRRGFGAVFGQESFDRRDPASLEGAEFAGFGVGSLGGFLLGRGVSRAAKTTTEVAKLTGQVAGTAGRKVAQTEAQILGTSITPIVGRVTQRFLGTRVGQATVGLAAAEGVRTGTGAVSRITESKEQKQIRDRIGQENFNQALLAGSIARAEAQSGEGIASNIGFAITTGLGAKGGKQAFEEAAIESLRNQGLSEKDVSLARSIIRRERLAEQTGEAAGLLTLSGFAERIGRTGITRSFEKAKDVVVQRPQVFGSVFRRAAPSVAIAGVFEGAGAELLQQRARREEVRILPSIDRAREGIFGLPNVDIGVVGAGAVGGASAGLLGGLIAGLRPVAPVRSRTLEAAANIIDPFELPGGLLESGVTRIQKRGVERGIKQLSQNIGIDPKQFRQVLARGQRLPRTPVISGPSVDAFSFGVPSPVVTETKKGRPKKAAKPSVRTPVISATGLPSLSPSIVPPVIGVPAPVSVPDISTTLIPSQVPTTALPLNVNIPVVDPLPRIPLIPPIAPDLSSGRGLGATPAKRAEFVNELQSAFNLLGVPLNQRPSRKKSTKKKGKKK